MNSMGNTIKCLRKAMGVTQEEMAKCLGVNYQAVSKWENETTLPDISMIPALATYFGVTTDELFGYKLNVMTDKERLINFMVKNRILCRKNAEAGDNGGAADVQIEAIIVIVNRCHQSGAMAGAALMEEKYGAKVYSLITDRDIEQALKSGIIVL